MASEVNISDLENFLEKMGFGEYKKRVYMGVFKLREASIHEIGQVSKVPLPKIYEVVNELEEEGYITLTLSRPRRYSLVHPGVVFDKIIKEREEQLSAFRMDRDMILNLFNTLSRKPEEKFELLRGREKVLNVLTNELKFNTVKSYWAVVAFHSVSTPLMPIFKRKAGRGLDVRVVGPLGKDYIIRKYLSLGVKVRIVDHIKEPIRFSIYDNKRLAFTLADIEKDYVTLWTDSTPLVKNMRNLFLHYWNNGGRYNDSNKAEKD